jgi:hypothetical protein
MMMLTNRGHLPCAAPCAGSYQDQPGTSFCLACTPAGYWSNPGAANLASCFCGPGTRQNLLISFASPAILSAADASLVDVTFPFHLRTAQALCDRPAQTADHLCSGRFSTAPVGYYKSGTSCLLCASTRYNNNFTAPIIACKTCPALTSPTPTRLTCQ